MTNHIQIKKGLNIPIQGKPKGLVQSLKSSGEASLNPTPMQIALDLTPFEDIKFRLLVKEGDQVKIGQPLVEDKGSPGRMFVSPAGGAVKEIRRGLKRHLTGIIIDVDTPEKYIQYPIGDANNLSREDIIEQLKASGMLTCIRQRPFNRLVNPNQIPRCIFVKALESAPFIPPTELQLQGHEKAFQVGLNILAKLTSGDVHLVYHKNSNFQPFLEAQNVQKHTAEGPHPISNFSVHIQAISPIKNAEDVIWTLDAHDVAKIGHLFTYGRYLTDKIVAIAGSGIIEGKTGFFTAREGHPIKSLLAGRITQNDLRFISGDVLTGHQVDFEGFLGFNDYCCSVIPENIDREFLHFFRTGSDKYSFSRAYLSGHRNNTYRNYPFTTNQHGEVRAFIDGSLYDEVMPLNISTINLVKAVLAEDYDLAVFLGLLEVDSEDFALPTFVCPSKIEMMEIIKQGLSRYATDVLS
jgi:Na+-transporting NADH:ubiquinone oxidoreductase subunit A